MAALLAPHFTVFTCDRRGRGDSVDQAPYAVEREVEDLDALITAAGGSACVYGASSGAVLAAEAAARGLAITKLALYEPPFILDESRPTVPEDFMEQLVEMILEDRRGDAVAHFMTKAVGVPDEFVAEMRLQPKWRLWSGQRLPSSMMSPSWAAASVASHSRLSGSHGWAPSQRQYWLWLEAQALNGQTHDVAAEAIAPVLREFFSGQ